MSDKSSEPSISLLWPTLLSFAVAVSGYLALAPQFTSQRPRDDEAKAAADRKTQSEPQAAGNEYDSRLWEDPLGDAYRGVAFDAARKAWAGKAEPFAEIAREPRLLVVTVPKGKKPDDRELRLRTRYAVHAALGAAGYRPDANERLRVLPLELPGATLVVPFERFRDDWARRTYGSEGAREVRYDDVLVFWMPVDAAERNSLRNIGALREAVCGKLGVLPERPKTGNAERTADPRADMAVQVIGPYNSDLLLGMTEELTRLSRNTSEWHDAYGTIQLYPWRATMELTALKNVRSDRNDTADPGPWQVPEIVRVWNGLTALSEQGEAELKNEQTENKCPVRATRLAGTEWHLAQAIREELRLRGAWPGDGLPVLPRKRGFVALITEKDTLYGNTIPLLYRAMLPGMEVTAAGNTRSPLIVYRYLQGVDGSSPLQEVPVSKKGEAADQRQVERAQGRDPQGNYQVDYLRRLADDLAQQDCNHRAQGFGPLRAIGIVGSDVYDKLLVLRALRQRFPGVWFFTHDLHDDYSRPSELEYAQNLLVASHFALSLHPGLQRETPPFRDSYQTSAYLATLVAIRDARTKDLFDWRAAAGVSGADLWPMPTEIGVEPPNHREERAMEILSELPRYGQGPAQHLRPLVFEIGRQGPYQLTYTGPRPAPAVYWPNDPPEDFALLAGVQPPDTRQLRRWPAWGYPAAFTCFLAFCAVLATQITAVRKLVELASPWPRGRRMPKEDGVACWLLRAAIVVLALVVVLIVWSHFDQSGQPFALFDGLSAWPGVLLRFAAIVAAVVFCWHAVANLDESWDDAARTLLPNTGEAAQPPNAGATVPSSDTLASWIKEAAGGLWYPFIVMLLLVIARQRLFSGDNYPLMLAVVQLALLLVLYFHTWRLRTETDAARKGIVRALKQRSGPGVKAEIDEAIKDIEAEEEGAFGHWTQDYFLKALALPFLGETGFLLLQRWMQ